MYSALPDTQRGALYQYQPDMIAILASMLDDRYHQDLKNPESMIMFALTYPIHRRNELPPALTTEDDLMPSREPSVAQSTVDSTERPNPLGTMSDAVVETLRAQQALLNAQQLQLDRLNAQMQKLQTSGEGAGGSDEQEEVPDEEEDL